MVSDYFTDWSVDYWKRLPPDVSGPRHGMKLKLSPKYFLDIRWLLIMSSTGSCDNSPFYKPENKLKFFVLTGEAGLP